ncbi:MULTISPECIES: tyrosine-protein kinase family protein [unclassified Arenibacter]|uniref:GumC family protein n=1 Tax=unclassified Arenibacter TaxID=2615047 RepID=UPI000E349B53|nr:MULTISPECIES: tyrosine-protein kinase family protein [unclassified Arenibacter]MCM4163341.1 tyrosine protein kinase [Arenibacter sp. A80]RFT57350.1 polysaccharide biosynthesis tyrosine autokinase [Arenibacter sp. P308M17]
MKEFPNNIERLEEDESKTLIENIKKYLRYWPWFLLTTIVCIGIGYIYIRYAQVTYNTVAKIKIIDDTKETDIASDAIALLSRNNKINLENEIEVLKSYRILKQVVDEHHLDIAYYEVGKVKSSQLWVAPFIVEKQIAADSLQSPMAYEITMNAQGLQITDANQQVFTPNLREPDSTSAGLPFTIKLRKGIDPKFYEGINFRVVLNPIKQVIFQLIKDIQVQATSKSSEILSLSINGGNIDKNEAIINTLIEKFNRDGILDRQLVSKRTLDFIDERFIYLTQELDSIEGGKESFKRSNNLSYIEADAGASLQKKSETEAEANKLDNQISISILLKQSVINQTDYGLLPANIGLENTSLNTLVSDYNQLSLDREKLLQNVGREHPTLVALNEQLERAKVNIIKSVNIYETQLKNSLQQVKEEESRAGSQYARLPEKEKMLRSIERQQSIKENLFLLLLQKREEAAISYAVTAPSVKIVDYGLTNSIPVSPKKMIVYALSLIAGMFLPFAVLYIRFTLDTKIHNRNDIEKLTADIPVVAEIPFFKEVNKKLELNDRSIMAESFRMLGTNINFLLEENDKGLGHVVMVTSSIKGEGKTLMAHNLSLAYAGLNKKVLLIGADLRNPQLHNFYNISVNHKGLSDYLKDPDMNWKDCLVPSGADQPTLHIFFGGAISSNSPQLLSSSAFEKFITAAKKEFDYIVVDTAPTMLVSDTLLISKYADATLFVTRAGLTDKRLLESSKNLYKTKKLKNMAYVVNGVGNGKAKGYNYGYGYGYGSGK